MNYSAILSLGIYCLSFVLTIETQAQYVPAYDKNGNSRYSPLFKSEEVRKTVIINSYGSNPKPSTSQSSSTGRSMDDGSSESSLLNEKRYYNMKMADANGLFVERSPSNNLYGYYNFKTGQEVITHSFTDYEIESEGYYGLKLDKWGFLDKTGKVMIPFRYDKIHDIFTNGIAKVESAGNVFWIDKNGNEVSDEKVNEIKSKGRLERYIDVIPTADENGLRLATKKLNGKILYCYLNNENIEVIGGDNYINYLPHSEGFYALRYDVGSSKDHFPFWVFIDKDNKRLANAWYGSIHSTFKNGKAQVTLYVPRNGNGEEAATIWIDRQGNEIDVTTPPPPTEVELEKAQDLAYQADNLSNLNLGNEKFETQNYSEAIIFYTKVIQQNVKRTLPDAYYGRGKAKLLLNEKEAACLDIKMAATLGHSGANGLLSKHCK